MVPRLMNDDDSCLNNFFIGTDFESLECQKIQHFLKGYVSERIFFEFFSFVVCTKKWTKSVIVLLPIN